MFPSLAARETYLKEANLRLGSKEMFLNQVKNIFASQTQILLPKRMFPLIIIIIIIINITINLFQCQNELSISANRGHLQFILLYITNIRRNSESCECVLANNQINHKVFPICFLFSFKVFLHLLCISLVPLIFPYSAQILLENALLCRQNARLKNRSLCSKFCRQNLSKPSPHLLCCQR